MKKTKSYLVLTALAIWLWLGIPASAYAANILTCAPDRSTIREILIWIATCQLPTFAGFAAIFGLITAGIMYIMASGDAQKMEKAKKSIGHIIIGIAIVVLSVVLVTLVKNILNKLMGP